MSAASQVSNSAQRGSATRLAHPINDVCATLGISRATLYKLIAAKKVRLTKIAGRSLIHDDEVQRLARDGA